jgi:hypothetical protein
MFETCEAKLGVFPALFGHDKKSPSGKAGDLHM